MSAGIFSLIVYRQLPDVELLKLCEKLWKLNELLYDENIEKNYADISSLHYYWAAAYARLGKHADAIAQLKLSAKYTKDFDNRPDETVISSLLLGEITIKKVDHDTDDTRSESEIMRDKWLASPDFDVLRDTNDFREIINILR